MLKNIIAVAFMLVLLVEMYFITAGSNHRKKKKLKGWNPASGKITKIEDVNDAYTRKSYKELTITTKDGHTVYSKQSPMFCIYRTGEKVELIEKDGVHRFIGNDRVNAKARKELLIGTIPMIMLILIAALISYLAYIWS